MLFKTLLLGTFFFLGTLHPSGLPFASYPIGGIWVVSTVPPSSQFLVPISIYTHCSGIVLAFRVLFNLPLWKTSLTHFCNPSGHSTWIQPWHLKLKVSQRKGSIFSSKSVLSLSSQNLLFLLVGRIILGASGWIVYIHFCSWSHSLNLLWAPCFTYCLPSWNLQSIWQDRWSKESAKSFDESYSRRSLMCSGSLLFFTT